MAQHNETGILGEHLAANFLKNAGYEIITTNWRYLKYELDIIAKINDTIVFVEVKTRTPNMISRPENSINRFKQKHLIEAGNAYLNINDVNNDARIDVVFIYIKDKRYWIKHIENAILPKW